MLRLARGVVVREERQTIESRALASANNFELLVQGQSQQVMANHRFLQLLQGHFSTKLPNPSITITS